MTREEYLAKQREESAALLAAIDAEVLAMMEAAEHDEAAEQGIEYIPDGGGEKRRTRSGRALLDLD